MKNDKIFEKYISETTIIDYYITENIIIYTLYSVFSIYIYNIIIKKYVL